MISHPTRVRQAKNASTMITPKKMVAVTAITQVQFPALSMLKSLTIAARRASGGGSAAEMLRVNVSVRGGVSVNVPVSVASAVSVSENVAACVALSTSVQDLVFRMDFVRLSRCREDVLLGLHSAVGENETLFLDISCDGVDVLVLLGDVDPCERDDVFDRVGVAVREPAHFETVACSDCDNLE